MLLVWKIRVHCHNMLSKYKNESAALCVIHSLMRVCIYVCENTARLWLAGVKS